MRRLSAQTSASLPPSVQRPAYEPGCHGSGIVHLGLGAFHRAHQAVYTDEVLNRYGGDWRITAVSLRSAQVQAQLAPQDALYTVTAREGLTSQQRLIGAIAGVLVAPAQPQEVLAALARAQTRVVTLTITEKAYAVPATVPEDGAASALGLLVQGLALRRRETGTGTGLSLMSCDNLVANGRRLEAAVRALCELREPGLGDWVSRTCSFPSSMVDRMVPATTAADLDALDASLGLRDEAAVFTESYSQWVIEDRFKGPIPAWDRVGAQIVADLAPYEQMKLRLLNAGHSAIAYLGLLAGYRTVAEAMADARIANFVARLMHAEAGPTLSLPPGYPLEAYCRRLVERFANPALRHRTAQIAADGSVKIPQRVLPVLRWNLEHGGPIDCCTLIVAAWLRCMTGMDERGRLRDIEDPLAPELARIARARGEQALTQLLRIAAVFGDLFVAYPRAAAGVRTWMDVLARSGAGLLETETLLLRGC